MKVAIIDYGSGNLRSAQKAFERMAQEHELNADIMLTNQPQDVITADRIVLPGVGAYRDCRTNLDAIPGMWQALDEQVNQAAKPFMGICIGMQLMASRGLEHGISSGFDWISGDVVAISPDDDSLKVPHMGWNTLSLNHPHPVFADLQLGPDGLHGYFVHSYHFVAHDPANILATTDYGGPLTAVVARDNMIGTQFHPEKSQALGLAVIGNFLRWQV